ncbi:MAG TPA: HlyD family efflux transporter periplasmic adaptor subunit [Casimicrobiaceae bacterium]|nr:HlyD family efflux transporter periplasmic adaptor subunit [Casimicrobiaceae bacterium]
MGGVVVLLIGAGGLGWYLMQPKGLPEGFASSNGRIEATEIDVATKLPGRLKDIYVKEGELVKAGQVVAQMDVETLEAQRAEARAKLDQATHAVATNQAEVNVRKSDTAAAQAMVTQRQTELDAARRRLARTETLSKEGAESIQRLDDDRATVRSAEAAVSASQARVAAAEAAIVAAETQAVGARSNVAAAQASIDRITADINDSQLKAPRDGRVQFKVTEPGEVLYPGGKVLNLVDLTDVYMTFFLPEQIAGRLAVGSEARLVLDAAPQWVIPATVTFVADVAQFTPKTVETAEERQKLTFRIKAHIPADLLRKHITVVKTGLPGVAYVKVDPNATWPANLAPKPTELAQ